MSRCQHDHIVQIKGLRESTEKATVQLELELAPFGSIAPFGTSSKEQKSAFPHRLEQFIQVASALNYLHTEARIVHGGVNLSHMLVFRQEGDAEFPSGLIKLCSFSNSFDIGATGQPAPALDCRPPESFTDEESIPALYRSFATITMQPSYDVYSLGRLILRRLLKIDPDAYMRDLGGKVTEEEYCTVLREHRESIRDGSRIQEAARTLPDRWRDLVMACCALDPTERVSAKDLIAKLIEARQWPCMFTNP